ncbi:hypothetical protein JY452_02925 [Stenotrophomonas maltophilia]|uniref:hypothetical protein n=1 Tax=Stenotrophomonas TaxID=40323 RepID=UPI00122F488F|nr:MULTISPECIES: hypothetical protein [unclassified Stenotrophomonas]KAA3597375.1 hypothetical protein D1178_19150 [Stenotrophomonas maltophilia]MBN5124959.1 hypothetical protein [Stenotrophomonas maltophilia]MBN5175766.1 hypothetical protein [Stenotrophomonas maltophilia]MCU1123549.1 hypothetical protein [Stenotrophomonas maltophilia]MDQ7276152.1 hypothetical protein [Stenotrophomonas sp. Sm3147]
MDAIEKRARELLAQAFGCEPGELLPVEVRAVRAVLAYHAALTPPEGYVLVPAELPDMGEAPGFVEGHYSRSNWRAAIADLQWLGARPEVP